jgi:hypothetical protein
MKESDLKITNIKEETGTNQFEGIKNWVKDFNNSKCNSANDNQSS